jgi:PhnB protein
VAPVTAGGRGAQGRLSYYDKLKEGGIETIPLAKAPWGDSFGMIIDRFGTAWLANSRGEQPAT